jgi:uncharacterized protein YgbK (DUF1537 family)
MTLQPPFGMIADDLTGACDAGVQFVRHGFSTTVWLDQETRTAEMNVVTTDSRADSPPAACAKVRDACLIFQEHGIALVYKKIDSTLSGNVAEEIEAALEASGRPAAWITPAFPAMGRTVVKGKLLVGGVERGCVPASGRLLPQDACSEEDLGWIVSQALASEPQPLLAGSAGLAAELAAALAAVCGRRQGVRPRLAISAPPVCLIGSQNPVTRAQVERLRSARPDVLILEVAREHCGPEAVLRLLSAGALIISGGDTARFVCRVLQTAAIRMEGELLTGIPLGRLTGGKADGLPVVTKAGGFGEETALVRVVEYLEGQ